MINTLLVGFGFSAKTFHLPFIQALDDFSLTAVVSSRPDAVKEVLPKARVWANLEDALQATTPDLVIITTPNHLHVHQAKVSLLANAHVLVEKPFTLSSHDAKELVALAAQQGRHLCVYHNRRFDGDFLTIKSLIKDGSLGEIKRFESRFDRFRPTPRQRWREQPGQGSGIFWDLGPHLIDQALHLFGLPDFVTGQIDILRPGGETDDYFDCTLHYSDKLVKLGSSPFQAATTLRFDMQGTKGSYRLFGLDPQEQQLKDGVAFTDKKWAARRAEDDGTLYTSDSQLTIATHQGGYVAFYQQLAKAIIDGTDPLPVDAASVVHVIGVIERLRESAMQQQRLLYNAN